MTNDERRRNSSPVCNESDHNAAARFFPRVRRSGSCSSFVIRHSSFTAPLRQIGALQQVERVENKIWLS